MNTTISPARKARTALRTIVFSDPVREGMRRSPLISSAVMRLGRIGERTNTGWSDESRYCYSVWMRHLVHGGQRGLSTNPHAIAELGPGDSLGIGLCGVLCGANRLTSLDAYRYANAGRTLAVLHGLIALLQGRADIPSSTEYPEVWPRLESAKFPEEILTAERLEQTLDPARIQRIIEAISEGMTGRDHDGIGIRYQAPWNGVSTIDAGTIDVILSQAAMEHVRDLDEAYQAMASWLIPGGHISHQIDFRSHGTSPDLNGHWIYPERLWQSLANEKTYRWINRQPCSAHLDLARHNGLETIATVRVESDDGIRCKHLSPQWQHLTEEDLRCFGVLLLARKP